LRILTGVWSCTGLRFWTDFAGAACACSAGYAGAQKTAAAASANAADDSFIKFIICQDSLKN